MKRGDRREKNTAKEKSGRTSRTAQLDTSHESYREYVGMGGSLRNDVPTHYNRTRGWGGSASPPMTDTWEGPLGSYVIPGWN